MARCYAVLAFFIAQIFYAHAGEAPVHLRLSTQNPPTMPSFQILTHFKQRVEAASKGGIAIEIFDSGKLYSDDKIGHAVSSGAIEIGFVNQAWYAATIPGVGIFQLPFMFNSDALLAAARTPASEIRTIIDQAILTQEGARVLFWVSQGQIVLVSHNTSLTNPDRIAGKTVRAAGPVMQEFVGKCGGIPKKVKLTDMLSVYERHEVEIGMHPVTVVAGFKLWTVFDKLTKTHHASAQFVVAINEQTWQSLSEGQRAIITEAARAAEIEATDHVGSDEAAAYRQIAEDGRLTVESLTEEELMRWRICSSDVLAEYVNHSGSLGGELIAAYGRLLQLDMRPQGQKAPPLSSR
jgi:TRAP-type C4-dicarboxylate transport system substrate-binding protein